MYLIGEKCTRLNPYYIRARVDIVYAHIIGYIYVVYIA